MQKKHFKILLLSGGADSMLLNQTNEYDAKVFFDYGQEHVLKEYNCCKNDVTHYIKLEPKFAKKKKEVNCRNYTFISLLVSMFGNQPLEIHLGTNSEDKYKDNNREFYNNLEGFINQISFNEVKIATPLIQLSKNQILEKLKSKFYTD